MATPGCYKITHKASGKFYVGSSIDIHNRWDEHRSELNHPDPKKHHNSYLQAAWDKYGEDAFDFEILAICPENMVRDVEQSYLDEIFAHPKPKSISYNLSESAYSPVIRGEDHPFYGKPHTEDHRRKISEANKGKKHTEDHRRKISKTLTGRELCEETKRKISEANSGENHPNWGKELSESTKSKISEANKGQVPWNKGLKGAQEAWNKGIPASEEQKRKQSIAMKGKPAWNKGKKQPKITCPWCGKTGGSIMHRWHMDNCKHKETPCP